EHGLNISRRPADHTEDFARGSLLIEGLGEVSITGLELLEEPNILDGNNRLVGEGLEESHLGIGKWAHIGTQNRETTKWLAFAEQRDLRNAVDRVEFQQFKCVGILAPRHYLDVVDNDGPTIQNRASTWELTSEGKRQAYHPLHLGASMRSVVEAITLQSLDHSVTRCT